MSIVNQNRTYCPITEGGFQAMRADLAKDGIQLPDQYVSPPDGISAGHGITVRWQYTPDPFGKGQGVLLVRLDGPGWLMSMAWDKLDHRVKPYVLA